MKISISLIVVALAAGVHADVQAQQSDCEREVDAKLNEMWNVSSSLGSTTQKKIMDRAMACMQGGQCSKPEALVRLQEIMVDDQVIELQKKKVTALRRFASSSGPNANACAVAALLPPLIAELTALNAQQLARFEALAHQHYPARPKQ